MSHIQLTDSKFLLFQVITFELHNYPFFFFILLLSFGFTLVIQWLSFSVSTSCFSQYFLHYSFSAFFLLASILRVQNWNQKVLLFLVIFFIWPSLLKLVLRISLVCLSTFLSLVVQASLQHFFLPGLHLSSLNHPSWFLLPLSLAFFHR